jgi:site-specific recombinase XerC
MTTAIPAQSAEDPTLSALRAALLAQGLDAAAVDAAVTAAAAAVAVYRVADAVTDALPAMRRDLPDSVKTWGPYLQMLTDGLPGVCPCSCVACSTGTCPCGQLGRHHSTCRMPADNLHTDCSTRYPGVADLALPAVTPGTIADAAWWVERRALKRTVRRNARREVNGDPLLHSDGRGAREQFIQACRWMFSWLVDEEKSTKNPAAKLKLPPRQEAGARSLDAAEFVEVYGVAVTTGNDPALDGLLMRHLLIQAVRRGGLLNLVCEGLKVDTCEIGYWDKKKKTWRYRPTTRTHLADLITHAITRGPRVAAPVDASEEERRHGIPALLSSSPVFYARPIDTYDEHGYFVARVATPISRKRIEGLFTRIRRHLPWAMRVGLRCHDIRHTSGRIIYRAADQQMAKLHLAHDGGSTTDHYLKEHLDELAKLKERLFEINPDVGESDAGV